MTLPPPSTSPSPAPSPASPAAAATPAASPPAPPTPVEFPLSWLLEYAAPAIQFRAVTEVARLPLEERGSALPLTHRPTMALALHQARDGTWNRSMLAVPTGDSPSFAGVGTISAVRRLLESGWDRDSPPLVHARRVLFRLLAEDDDPEYLFEFAGEGGHDAEDEDLARRGRAILREAAAAALAQAGYEGDPRLRGAARRIIERVGGFLRSPLGQKPFVRIGNQHVLAPEAAPPSIHALLMLAHMPLFRAEHYDTLERLYQFLSQPLPRQESVQLCGKRVIAQPHLVLGDLLPHRNAVDADVPFALFWLELMARLGYLRRNEGWCKLFDRFLEDRDAQGVWHPHKGMATVRSSNPYVWPMFPLEEVRRTGDREGEERWTDVTFRLGLIARLSGRPIELL